MIHLCWIIGSALSAYFAARSCRRDKNAATPAKVSEYKANENENQFALPKTCSIIEYDTTSHSGVDEAEKFRGFHKVLEELFPLVHKNLEKTEIDGNLLYYWKGKSHDNKIC